MRYPELMIAPMRRELTAIGLRELRTAEEVDSFMAEVGDGTALLAINSMCGCSAGSMRPAVAAAVKHTNLPAKMATVFAGQDQEATARAREYITDYPPSSPAVALFKGGKVVFMLERHQIQGRHPDEIAADLIQAFDTHCAVAATGE